MTRPVCAICGRNPARNKGKRRGKATWDYKCGSCHKQGRKGNPNGALPRRETVAKQRIPGHEERLQSLYEQIGALKQVKAQYLAMKKKVRRWRERQEARKAQPFWGHERYRRYKKECCETCGFIAENPCQLDVDHVDGNGANHDPANLQTLCANCHRLKTHLSGDHLTPRGARIEPVQGELIN